MRTPARSCAIAIPLACLGLSLAAAADPVQVLRGAQPSLADQLPTDVVVLRGAQVGGPVPPPEPPAPAAKAPPAPPPAPVIQVFVEAPATSPAPVWWYLPAHSYRPARHSSPPGLRHPSRGTHRIGSPPMRPHPAPRHSPQLRGRASVRGGWAH